MEYVFLKDIATITNGKINAQDAVENGIYPLFDRSNTIKKSNQFLFEKEAILVPGEGKTFIPKYYVGKFDLHQRCYAIFDFKNSFNAKFVFWYIFWNQQYFQSVYTGSTVPSLRLGNFEKMPIPVYSVDEQNRIVALFDNLNRTIEIKNNSLNALNELVKSRFIEMFGGIDLSPQKTEWKALGDLGTIYTGTTPSTADAENWDGDVLWITPAEMDDNSFLISDTVRKITNKGQKSKSLSLMPIGTVLLSTRAPIGKVGIVNSPMTCNQGFKNFYCPKTLNSVFLYVLLKNNIEYLNSIGTGTTFKEISKSNCAKIKVPVPELPLQNEFADFVKLIDKSKFVCQLKPYLLL